MPSVLSDADKETVRRVVPKGANKIHAVAVAKLYVALPNKQRWTYTGLQGAAVLANDLVGNTYWIKLVDVSVRQRFVCATNPTLTWSRVPIAELSGTRRFMSHSITTKTGLSFTHSNWRIVWQDSHLWTRKKPNSLRKRWMIEKRMQANRQKPLHFKAPLPSQQLQLLQMANPTIASALEVCCMVKGPHPLRTYHPNSRRLSSLPANHRNPSRHRPVQIVIDHLLWTP